VRWDTVIKRMRQGSWELLLLCLLLLVPAGAIVSHYLVAFVVAAVAGSVAGVIALVAGRLK